MTDSVKNLVLNDNKMLGPPTASFPAVNSQQRISGSDKNARKGSRSKVALKPGRSLMDWVRLANGGKDIQGLSGKTVTVTPSELAKHNTVSDCWMAIRGRVYNVTHYMEYHPGGLDELMKGAGKDATELFDQIHKWVNFTSMLAKCYIGPLKPYSIEQKLMKRKLKTSTVKKDADGFVAPGKLIPTKPTEIVPRYDWYEKEEKIFLSIYTKTKLIDSTDIILDCHDEQSLKITILMGEKFYLLFIRLQHEVSTVQVTSVNGNKADFVLTKSDSTLKWTQLGKGLDKHDTVQTDADREIIFRDCTVKEINQITHDTKSYTIHLPDKVYYEVPIGHHVIIKDDIEGMEMRRNYTVCLPSLTAVKRENKDRGTTIDLIIKHYSDGALTPLLNRLNIGDRISMSDCIGTFKRQRLKDANNVYMIAAGTGITPMLRIINYYFIEEAIPNCRLKLFFANKKEVDIIWKDQFDSLALKYPDRFHVTYILSNPNQAWRGLKGRITADLLKAFVTENPFTVQTNSISTPSILTEETILKGLDKLYAICGPDQFTNSMESLLNGMDVEKEIIHCFLG
eukprot:TCONS_00069790-protein